MLSIETILPNTLPQEITVSLNDRIVEKKIMKTCARVQIYIDNGEEYLNEAVVECKNAISPGNGDTRFLSIKVNEIQFYE